MIGPWVFLGAAYLACAVLFVGVWLYCQRMRNAGYIDVAWALALVIGVGLAGLMLGGEPSRTLLVGVIAGLWALRLFVYLFKRVHGDDEEDGRYQHMRRYYGDKASLAFFVFFQLQALFVVLFLLPILAAMTRPGALDWRDALGVAVWLVAVGGEALADHQLAAFKREPASKGRVCKRGLWRYSRHPNYFFEWVHWFAYLAIGARASESIGYAALAGPVVMGLFLVFVTGVPYTEMRAVQSKGQAYKQYQRETSVFFPWFPRPSDRD